MHRAKPLVEGTVESDVDRYNKTEVAEVEVYVRAVYKELITLAETHLESEVEVSGCKAKLRVSSSMSALLTSLRLRMLFTGYDEGFMEEDG